MNEVYREQVSLSLEEALSMINAGGWFVTGGQQLKERGTRGKFLPEMLVTGAVWNDGKLYIYVEFEQFVVPAGDIFLLDPSAIQFRYMTTRMRDRARAEGGGKIEDPCLGVSLRLSNQVIKKQLIAHQDEQAELAREEMHRQRMADLADPSSLENVVLGAMQEADPDSFGEIEILLLLAQRKVNPEIAAVLATDPVLSDLLDKAEEMLRQPAPNPDDES